MSLGAPSAYVTDFFAGMHDPAELIGWIVRLNYAPWQSSPLIPLCVTPENCPSVLRTIGESLGIRYLRNLERLSLRMTPDTIEANKYLDTSRHYAISGIVDLKYIAGVSSLKNHIDCYGHLENEFETTRFQLMYDPRELIAKIADAKYTPALAASVLPLCVTELNFEQSTHFIRGILGESYIADLEAMSRFSDINVISAQRDFPASQHYNLKGQVDPEYLNGIQIIKKYRLQKSIQ